jgi:S1-C subfamily serine protease
VRLANQKVVRWLVTNDQNQTNKPIQGIGYGSGFVVERTGLILTNKHVAARWSTPYGLNYYEDRCNNCARIFDQDEVDTGPGKEAGKPFTPTSDDLYDWIPGEEGLLFKENKAEVIDGPKKTQQGLSEGAFEGRSEQLDVHFSGQNMSVPARFIRASLEADMALAKIDIPFNLKTAAMIDELKDQPPTQGDRVAVLGYPDISQRTYSTTVSLEAGQPKPRVSMIPEPTITDGIISSIGRGIEPVKGTWLNMTYGSVGDVYQLTVNTGQGNSGGPVIDSTGKVIAIFTYAVVNRNGDKVTYAVPIKYGKQLMELQGRLD